MKFISKILLVALLVGGASDALVGMNHDELGSGWDGNGRRFSRRRQNQQPNQQQPGSSLLEKIRNGFRIVGTPLKQVASGACGLTKKCLGPVVRYYKDDGFFDGVGKSIRDTGILLVLTGYGSSVESVKSSLESLGEPVTILMAAGGAILCIVGSKLAWKAVKALGCRIQRNKDSHQRDKDKKRLRSDFNKILGREVRTDEIDKKLTEGISKRGPGKLSRIRCWWYGICLGLRVASGVFMFYFPPNSPWFFIPGTEFSQLVIKNWDLPDSLSSQLIVSGLVIYVVDYQLLFGFIKNIKDFMTRTGILRESGN